MAKSKKSGKKSPAKTTEKDKKAVAEEVADKKSVKESKKVDEKKTDKKAEKPEKTTAKTEKSTKPEAVKAEEKAPAAQPATPGFFKKFFAKKYEENENILTIFKDKKVYGAILGEVFGTMFLALIVLTLGMYQPLYMFFVIVAAMVAVYKLSGANLNPINTVGMMATRRISVIRGVLYLLSQIVGAWLGVLLVSAFLSAAGPETELEGMAAIAEENYWVVTFLEFVGAAIVGFFFARAQEYKKSALTFAAVAAGGFTIATVVIYILSYNYFGLTNNFMMNPAVALMYQILPTSADGVTELLVGIGKALFTYVLFPMVGGVIGFFIADASKTLAE